jgi:hypothetical protein
MPADTPAAVTIFHERTMRSSGLGFAPIGDCVPERRSIMR